MDCNNLCAKRKSILKAKILKLPKRITITDHFTDLIQHGEVDPESAAIVGDYGQVLFTPMRLDLGANQLAKAMREFLGYWTNNNPDGDLVIAFCLHTTEKAVLMMLAILKLGATYLSLSTSYPEEQIVRIVGITRPLLIVTESNPMISSRFDCVKRVTEIVTFDELSDSGELYHDDPNDPVPLESLSPPWRRAACIIYTPGSTGEPHGVRIFHQAIFNRIYWQLKTLPYQKDEQLCLSSLLVDAESIGEIFVPLFGNRPLYIMPVHTTSNATFLLIDKIEDINITRITLTPTAFSSVLNAMNEIGIDLANEKLKSIKYWILSGDVVSYEIVLKFFEYFDFNPIKDKKEIENGCLLLCFYGATETTSEVTWEVFDDQEDFKLKAHGLQGSVGLPLCNNIVYIMDEDLNIVPEGTIGEICISGVSVSMGYSDKRDTTSRFVLYPRQAKPKKAIKLFRTGDYGKIMESDGGEGSRLYYEGRTDMIMQIQGREIELNDIVRAVNITEICTECAVICYHRNREDQTAVAFCVMKENTTINELKLLLNSTLEAIKMPDIYPVPGTLPYLPSGRLDRQKLLKMYKYRRMECKPEDWKALNLEIAEKQAAKVLFESICHSIGVTLRFVMANYNSSFWDIGGNSLNALIIVHTCRENGYLISIDHFVQAESLSSLVIQMVESSRNPVTDAQMVMHICDLAERELYSMESLDNSHKDEVISLLSKCYSSKSTISTLLNANEDDHKQFLECFWDEIMKEKSSIVARDKETNKLVGAALSMDINGRRLKRCCKRVRKPMSYCVEALQACEFAVRQTTINKDRGKVIRIFMIGTDSSVESRFNIVLIEYMLKGIMQLALLQGFSWILIMSTSPLIRDLCGTVLQYENIAELRLNSFVAKDKTKPFRYAGDFLYYRAYYRLFV